VRERIKRRLACASVTAMLRNAAARTYRDTSPCRCCQRRQRAVRGVRRGTESLREMMKQQPAPACSRPLMVTPPDEVWLTTCCWTRVLLVKR
jgi:hypothetical protein